MGDSNGSARNVVSSVELLPRVLVEVLRRREALHEEDHPSFGRQNENRRRLLDSVPARHLFALSGFEQHLDGNHRDQERLEVECRVEQDVHPLAMAAALLVELDEEELALSGGALGGLFHRGSPLRVAGRADRVLLDIGERLRPRKSGGRRGEEDERERSLQGPRVSFRRHLFHKPFLESRNSRL